MKKLVNKHKATAISYFIALLGVLVAGAVGSHIIGKEYSPLLFTVGGVFLEKLANFVKGKISEKL